MTVHFTAETDPSEFGFSPEETARKVLASFMEVTGCPYECAVEVILVGPSDIQEMNRQFRGIDRVTDVLSFPAADYAFPGDFAAAAENEADAFDPDSGELLLGDVVLCKDRILSQAKEYGHTVKREYAFLLAHSLLHLIGYDHETAGEREAMEQEQKRIMQDCGI